MKIYIAGKISGLSQSEYEANFTTAENYCKSHAGITEIVNPIKLDHSQNKEWIDHMRTDLKALLDCGAIYMQKNWEESAGARIEHDLALQLNFIMMYE